MDYSLFRNFVVKILCVVFCLVEYHMWNEALSNSFGGYESYVPEG